MLEIEDAVKAKNLMCALEDALLGNVTNYIEFMTDWLNKENLKSVTRGTLKNGVFAGEI